MATTASVILSGRDELSTKLELIRQKFEKITASGKPLNSRISEIRRQMVELTQLGADGSPLWESMAEQARAYQSQLDQVAEATRRIKDDEESFSLKDLFSRDSISNIADKAGLGGVSEVLEAISSPASAATAAVTAVATTLVEAASAANEFETHLAELQSLTGLGAQEMEKLNKGAIDMSREFRSSASEIVDSMKLIGSQAPELLSAPDALMGVARAANVLSEAAGIDVTSAAGAITGVMNQMGVSASQADDIINTLAASSQQGSADVAYLTTAFEKSGTNASDAGMSFVELAAAIEAVAPKFSSADVAGTALNGLLLKLSTQSNDRFKPAVVGMSKALENLAAAGLDDAQMQQMVGESGVVMLKSLIAARGQFDLYSQSLKGTNTAYEQMETNTDTFEGAVTRLKSTWEALLLTIGQSGAMEYLLDYLEAVMKGVGEIIDIVMQLMSAFEEAFDTSGSEVNACTYQFELLVKTLRNVGTVLEVLIRLYGKMFQNFKSGIAQIESKWDGFTKKLNDTSWGWGIIAAFNKIITAAANAINQLKKFWNELKRWLGMDIKADAEVKATLADTNTETQATPPAPDDKTKQPAPDDKTKQPAPDDKTKQPASRVQSKSTQSVDYTRAADDGSLDMAENKLRAYQKLLRGVATTDAAKIKQLNADIDHWQSEVDKRKLRINPELALEPGSLADFEKQLKDLQEKKKLLLHTKADPKDLRQLQQQIEKVQKAKTAESARLGLEPAEGSIADIEAKLKVAQDDLDELLKTDASAVAVKLAQTVIENIQKKLRGKKVALGLTFVPTIESKEDKDLFSSDVVDKLASQNNAQAMGQKVVQALNAGVLDSSAAQTIIDGINARLQELGLEPMVLHIGMDGAELTDTKTQIEKLKEQLKSLSSEVNTGIDSWAGLAEIIGSKNANAYEKSAAAAVTLGESMTQLGADGAAAKTGAVLSAVGQIVLGFAYASAEAAKLGPLGWMAFLGAGLAAASVAISTIKGFADGGIIGGDTFHGDAIVARLNAGEMILNRRQQGNLFRLLDAGGSATRTIPAQVRFVLEGDKLVGCINNHTSKMGLA